MDRLAASPFAVASVSERATLECPGLVGIASWRRQYRVVGHNLLDLPDAQITREGFHVGMQATPVSEGNELIVQIDPALTGEIRRFDVAARTGRFRVVPRLAPWRIASLRKEPLRKRAQRINRSRNIPTLLS